MESPGLMEVYIPIKNFNPNTVIISPPLSIYPMKLPVSNLSYSSPVYNIPKLSIFTNILKVHSWDPVKLRLELISDDNFRRINELQEIIINTIVQHPEWSGSDSLTYDDVCSKFQPTICNNLLILYLHSKSADKPIINSISSIKSVSSDSFHEGQLLRAAIVFKGLLFLKNTQGKLFYRLQHQVASIYL